MLKTFNDYYYKHFKISEKTLQPEALKRLRMISIPALLAVPLLTIFKTVELSGILHGLILTLLTVSFLCLILLSFSKIMNTFTRMNKNLDEWEIKNKQAAESFAYRVLLFGLMIALIVSALEIWLGVFNIHAVTIEGKYVGIIIMNLLAIFAFLPASYAAWTLKPLDVSKSSID